MIRTSIYQALANDADLAARLATKPAAIGEGPAIYENWAGPDTEAPYINLTYSFTATENPIKRSGTLSVDIFTTGYDTTKIEAIQKQIINILDLAIIQDPDEGPVRLYLDDEIDIPEEEPDVLHWNITFSIITWRRDFIARLNNR